VSYLGALFSRPLKSKTKLLGVLFVWFAALMTGAVDNVNAEEAAEIKSPIKVKFDVRTPMRDGITLSSNVFFPDGEGQFPVVLMRTPYLKTRDGPPPFEMPDFARIYTKHGYILVIQDVRGRGDSDGEFDYWSQEPEDGYDTIEWLAEQPWSNGKICMMGVSYMGANQWSAARTVPPHLTCLVSTAAAGLPWDEVPYRGGAFELSFALGWLNNLTGNINHGGDSNYIDFDKAYWYRPLIDADEKAIGRYMPLYKKFLLNSTYNEYWKDMQLMPSDFERIKLPVLHITGWFDGDQQGAMYFWEGMQKYSSAKARQFLLVGPWTHIETFFGGDTKEGEMVFTEDSLVDSIDLHLKFFDYYLKGTGPKFEFPRARIYLTGINEWREYDSYPPREAVEKRLYLDSTGHAGKKVDDGQLTWNKAGENTAVDQYIYDPKNPVLDNIDGKPNWGADVSFVGARDDVLVYTTEKLMEPLAIAGRLRFELYAASDALDTDFTVRILDVQPDGRALALAPAPGIIRARFRNGYEKEELLTPGKVERYELDMKNIGHVFLPGHAIRIEISSSYFPNFNPNQNTGNPVATDTEWKKANQTIYHDQARPSALVLPVLSIQ